MDKKLLFGKHKGKKFSEILEENASYCDWVLGLDSSDNKNMNEFQEYLKENYQSGSTKKDKKKVEPKKVQKRIFASSDESESESEKEKPKVTLKKKVATAVKRKILESSDSESSESSVEVYKAKKEDKKGKK